MYVDPNPLAHLWEWVLIHTGGQDEGRSYYGEWSGFLSDVSEFAIVGVAVTTATSLYRHHKCTTCRRIGRHKTEETAQRFCHHHWTHAEVARHRELHRLRFPDHIAHNPKEPS